MTTGSSLLTSYSSTASQKTMISDRILLADPHDIPTITALGLNNEAKFRFVNKPNKTYYWLEDTFTEITDTAAGANLTGTTSTTTITITYPNRFHVGDVIQIGAAASGVTDLAVVSSISSSVLTVVRGFGGGTSVSHPETSVIYIRGTARIEGADNSDSPWSEVSSTSNCSQIFHRSVDISRDDILFPNYGMADQLEYRIDKNMMVLLDQLNKLPYWGKRDAGSSTTSRGAGGLGVFITTNATALGGATLLDSHIDTELINCFDGGGNPGLILTDAWGQKKINDFYEGFISTERSEQMGGMIIKKLQHPITGGILDIVVDRANPGGYMYFIDQDYVGYITIDPFFYEQMAKVGDSVQGQTVGEYGFACSFNKAHSILSGYSTSA